MMMQRLLAIGLTAVLTLGVSVPVCIDVAGYYTEPAITICQTDPTLLTNEQLLELAITAPAITDTRSAVTMNNRRMTEAEIFVWSDEYWLLGGINDFELEVIRLINMEREAVGLPPLAINPQLFMAARFHSQEMADLQFFAHRSDIYGRSTARATLFGHENQQEGFFGIGENIHGGAFTPERVLLGWMRSDGHRRALLDPDALTIGVGSVRINDEGMGRTTAKFGF